MWGMAMKMLIYIKLIYQKNGKIKIEKATGAMVFPANSHILLPLMVIKIKTG
jgi:hypothetical protein